MRILIVEDDEIVADAIRRGLVSAQFVVDRVANAESAHVLLSSEQFDLAVIDIGLPGIDGLGLLQRLRTGGKTIPTLILTARDALDDKVRALDMGADDYLIKPFELTELVARCRALIRRANAAVGGPLVLGRMTVDMADKQLHIDGHPVELTLREWLVLECLTKYIGRVTPKDRLLQAIANLDQDITPNAVEVHISRLRGKLGNAIMIRSLRGLGYRLEEPPAS
jgi:DNA-binding response OmpR family regulator